MKHSLKAIVFFLLSSSSTVHAQQILTADNGLTRYGPAPNYNVKLGGTLDNASTTIDFGTSNSSSNLLIKKGTVNYLFIKNDGLIGVGTNTPSAKLDVVGSGGGNIDFQTTGRISIKSQNAGIWLHDNTSNRSFIGIDPTITNHAIGVYTASTSSYTFNILQNGNVGIGSTTPAVKLDINGSGGQNTDLQTTGRIKIKSVYGGIAFNDLTIDRAFIGLNPSITNNGIAIYTGGDYRFNLLQNGNLCLGNSEPKSKLDVTGGVAVGTYAGGTGIAAPANGLIVSGKVGIGMSSPNTNAQLDVVGNIFASGKVVIGFNSVTDITQSFYDNKLNSVASPYALAVKGSAIFERTMVKLNGNWPDYVFDGSYVLPSLNEVEAYITKNKHLSNVPSAEEIKKNGIDLGENQAALLQKIEELTLYMIDANKRIEELEKKLINQNR